jgi:release factor glutamine methyltransferase
MKSVSEVLELSASFLKERKVERPRRIAEDLLAHLLKMKRMDLYLQFDRPVIEAELSLMREYLKKVIKGTPIDYVTGSIDFMGCTIEVDKRVLIPRPETEILVDHVLKRARGNIIWDVCTGSGCIGLALKKERPDWSVTLSDLSKDAVEVAKSNQLINELDVEILQGDLFEPFRGRKADVIVCNPPYISKNEYESLEPSVKNFEPMMALVGGERGDEFYRRIAQELPHVLSEGGQVFFEIGFSQGELLKEIFSNYNYQLLNDWAGHPRFFFLEKQ